MTQAVSAVDWQAWQDSWDRQQEWYMPDREERFRVMLDMVEAVVGPEPRVLDLACGTGSITDRLLKRFPNTVRTGVDLDPSLFTIAQGYFAGDDRDTFVAADLKDPNWTRGLPYESCDAVLTATALHWLRLGPLATLYGQLAGLVRDGGVFMNADHMIDGTTPPYQRGRTRLQARADGSGQGRGYGPGLVRVVATGGGRPRAGGADRKGLEIYDEHADGETPSVEWHAGTLRAAGFGEARTVWASPSDALVLALK